MAAAKKKTAPKKALVKKPLRQTVTAKKTPIPSSKKPVAKKPVAKKPAAKKSLGKKAAAKKPAAKKPAAGKAAAKKTPAGIPEILRDAALKVLDEKQAEEIVTISLAGRSSVADYIIIASARANRQVAALADYLREAFATLGVRQIRIEGQSEANWVLVDAGDVIIHIFRPDVRRYYDLDGIWQKNRTAPSEP